MSGARWYRPTEQDIAGARARDPELQRWLAEHDRTPDFRFLTRDELVAFYGEALVTEDGCLDLRGACP